MYMGHSKYNQPIVMKIFRNSSKKNFLESYAKFNISLFLTFFKFVFFNISKNIPITEMNLKYKILNFYKTQKLKPAIKISCSNFFM